MAGMGAWVWVISLLGLCLVGFSKGGSVGGLGLVGAYLRQWRAWLVGDGVVLAGGIMCLYDSYVGKKGFDGLR